MKVENYGDQKSPIWVIVTDPYKGDEDKGYIYSGGHGYNFRKVWSMAGLPDPYIHVLRPLLGASYDIGNRFSMLLNDLCDNAPPLIIPVSGEAFELFCPNHVAKSQRKAILKKYSGNLLQSSVLPYPHYIVPNYPPDYVGANWAYHEIQAFIDYGHVKEEWEFWRDNGVLQPLPVRNLVTEPHYDELMSYLYRIWYDFKCGLVTYISVDIETIRPKTKSFYHKLHHPGYPYTISIATSPYNGISFSLWDYDSLQLIKIWRELDKLLAEIPIIGQNFISFDAHYLEALGFRPNLGKVQDTQIRHHILWPGL